MNKEDAPLTQPVGSATDKEPAHIDDWVDGNFGKNTYARWFFFLHRLAAVFQMDWAKQIAMFKLFCTYQGKRYRVTGASRMGDVWLSEDFNRDIGYELRVSVENCSEWSPAPEVNAKVQHAFPDSQCVLSLDPKDHSTTLRDLEILRKTNAMVTVSSEELARLMYSNHDNRTVLEYNIERMTWVQELFNNSRYQNQELPCFPEDAMVGGNYCDVMRKWIVNFLKEKGFLFAVLVDGDGEAFQSMSGDEGLDPIVAYTSSFEDANRIASEYNAKRKTK